jgi:hypothetical protein
MEQTAGLCPTPLPTSQPIWFGRGAFPEVVAAEIRVRLRQAEMDFPHQADRMWPVRWTWSPPEPLKQRRRQLVLQTGRKSCASERTVFVRADTWSLRQESPISIRLSLLAGESQRNAAS